MVVGVNFNGSIARLGALDAVDTRRENRHLRDSEHLRTQNDIERRNAMQQIESSMRQGQQAFEIAQQSVATAQAAVKAGQTIDANTQQMGMSSDLSSGDNGALTNTSLGTDSSGRNVTVGDVLGRGSDGQPVTDPAAREAMINNKIRALTSGNDLPSEQELVRMGFTEGQARQLTEMRRTDRSFTMDEAAQFLYAQGPEGQRQQAFNTATEIGGNILKALQQGLTAGQSGAEHANKGAQRAMDEDHRSSRSSFESLRRVSWLAVEQQRISAESLHNQRGQSYDG
jgi:hypothetical protein